LTQRTAALEAAGFADLVNCVFADDDDVLDKLEWLFENPDELQRIIKAGRELVDSRHAIQQRNQVFQWYTLHKKLKPGQRIVQPGSFLPLTIVAEQSGIRNVHADSNGVDRLLMKQGDERLRAGEYDEAEALYRRCLNYQQPDIPEARFRLILCLLHKGDAKAALATLKEQFPSHRLVNEQDAEPDPTEWAWFIIALLCGGKNREAALRADQFASLHNEELSRVRYVIQMLNGETNHLASNESPAGHRASVHQALDVGFEAWLNSLQRMLEACRQLETVYTLARIRTTAAPKPEPAVSQAKRHSAKHSILKYSFAGGSRVNRFAQRLTSRAQQVARRISGGKQRGPSPIAGDERADIARLLQKEEIRSGVLLGATAESWLTDIFIQGMRSKPSRPIAVFANHDTAEFRALHKQFVDDESVRFRYVTDERESVLASNENPDIVAVNCLGVFRAEHSLTAKAALVVLAHINTRGGNEYLRAMLAKDDYVLVALEHTQFDGYAVFRKITPQRPILNSSQSALADYPIPLSA
jgi:tetratricopeptide (TPR) repeat protein